MSFFKLILFVLSLCFIFSCSALKNKNAPVEMEAEFSPLQVSANGRFLVNASGEPVFLNSGTEWRMAHQLDTNQVKWYMEKRKEQEFNAVAIVALNQDRGDAKSAYGVEPFERDANEKYDPTNPKTISDEYDFWDHLDYIIDRAEKNEFYVILLPTWGTQVAGLWNGETNSKQIFNKENAFEYGQWIGNRYKDKKHIIWMMGGDVSAITTQGYDYRDIFRALAHGVEKGVGNPLLMSYHPRKQAPNSSEWFHDDTWLDFNSIQDRPEHQLDAFEKDYHLKPVKPTWLFEGSYEGLRGEYKNGWQSRYQAYETVFAGGFGHTYGSEAIWGFFPEWETHVDDWGARHMQYVYALMNSLTDEEYLSRIPNQDLIIGDTGTADRFFSTRIQATQGSDGAYAFIYSANGRDITVKMDLLAQKRMDAYWYNPRNGQWHVNGKEYTSPTAFEKGIDSGPGVSNKVFDPPGEPGDENDWVLVLR